jgi:hypothetical protein
MIVSYLIINDFFEKPPVPEYRSPPGIFECLMIKECQLSMWGINDREKKK